MSANNGQNLCSIKQRIGCQELICFDLNTCLAFCNFRDIMISESTGDGCFLLRQITACSWKLGAVISFFIACHTIIFSALNAIWCRNYKTGKLRKTRCKLSAPSPKQYPKGMNNICFCLLPRV